MLDPDVEDPHATARDELRRAYREYMEASDQCTKLLLAIGEEPSGVQLHVIEYKQQCVDSARECYHAAREQYIRDVLGTMDSAGSGITLAPN